MAPSVRRRFLATLHLDGVPWELCKKCVPHQNTQAEVRTQKRINLARNPKSLSSACATDSPQTADCRPAQQSSAPQTALSETAALSRCSRPDRDTDARLHSARAMSVIKARACSEETRELSHYCGDPLTHAAAEAAAASSRWTAGQLMT